jgi:beta-lactamase superfamily II metal-dependent hydrolase
LKDRVLLLIVLLFPLTYGSQAFATESPELKIVFIDVEQGSSQLVIMPNGKTLLIDAGERDQAEAVLSAMQEHSVTRLDAIVATHPHADHIGGLIGVMNEVKVGEVFDSGQIHTTQTFEDFIDAIDANQIQLTTVHDGDSIELDPSVQLNVFNPPATMEAGADDSDEFNSNSVVIKLTYGEFTALLTGDMGQENEARLTGSHDIDVDVLLAGHHGSRTSSSSAFLDAVSPEVVVISLGAGNDYGHPHQQALDRINEAGAKHVFRTDIDGTIVLTTRGEDDFTLETAVSGKTVVVPEFGTALLIAGISLMSLVALYRRGRIWKSSGPA